MNLKAIGVFGLGAIILILGAAGGGRLVFNHFEPLLAQANEQVGRLSADNTALKAAIDHQNTALLAMEAEAQKRAAAAKTLLNRAKQKAVQSQTQAEGLLLEKPPVNSDLCAAAQKDFDNALKQERGVK